MRVRHEPPWLIADLDGPRRVLSWAINRPGFVTAERIVFREVRNKDLPEGRDPVAWLDHALEAAGLADAPTLLTSRNVASYEFHRAALDGATVQCLATVGLSNAERVGHRQRFDPASFGTINIAVDCSVGLTEAAQIEALSIATQARTAAVIDAGMLLPEGPATGTGTDCIAFAAPPGDVAFAGLHTAIGEAIGRAVYDAVFAGAKSWIATRPELLPEPE
ncbi:adenosylcobinamide amidohydrolase [Aliiruegeria sabulilitoris]|uniref:adenosylcobinamide amidohydrolase n=1 Tax=Aliiruegeria sabulilitoris TaxID=1510458 RepID=UPI000832D40C|nr:adenosylcobinamide amidohydrolase [Aliiruegeria sabulilitoris]NDR58416.1 adenosylcobinamide amidohydrolase [Pseudoruegeria sp. M32A2M]